MMKATGASSATGQDVVFCFDTTGSMHSCIAEVRGKLQDLCEKLTAEFGDAIRIAIMAIGDFCDSLSTYVVDFLDFTSNTKELVSFVKNVSGTGGGDYPEGTVPWYAWPCL